ncbi:MAG: prepilin-type N-terminal cleavage/methylation domain-containing protein [Calditrichaeota bacterium]|nr:MAG: prepilin-type N-terminal cleavage/methylation domain-containing protein [Calditrichota bacterium]
MYKLRKEQGFTLMEVIVVVVITGIALPSLFVLLGNISYASFSTRMMNTAVNLASSRMEEIQAFKDANWDWYKTIEDFETEESLNDGFTRTTTVEHIDDWDNTGYEAYQITIAVAHQKVENPYTVTMNLTLYSK